MNELLTNGRYEGTSAKAERFFTGLTQLTKLDTIAGTRRISATTTPRLVEDVECWWATQLGRSSK